MSLESTSYNNILYMTYNIPLNFKKYIDKKDY